MKRKFVTNLLLLLLLNVLIKPFWIFGIDRTAQNMVGAEDYGMYFSLFNFSLVLNILLDLGITNYNNRNIARHQHLLNKYVGNLIGLKILLAAGYVLICLIVALLAGYNRHQLYLLLFLIANQILVSLSLFLRSNISGLHLFRTDSFLSVLDRGLMIVLCSILLFTNWMGVQFSIEWFVYAQTVAYALSVLVTFLVLRLHSGQLKLNFKRHLFLAFLRKSYPYALLILLMSVYNRIDSVLIERLLPQTGKEQAGIYAQAFRLLDAFSMMGFLFAGLLLPMFARMIKQKEEITSLVRLAFLMMIVPALLVCVASNSYGNNLMALLYHQHIETSAPILGILMVGFLGIASTYIFGTLLTANGSLKLLNLTATTGVVLNVGLNLWLIPRFGAMGAAWISMATQLLMAVLQLLIVQKIFHLRIDYLLLLKLTGFVFFLILAAKISHFAGNWLIGLVLFSTAGILYAMLVKLINPRASFKLLKPES